MFRPAVWSGVKDKVTMPMLAGALLLALVAPMVRNGFASPFPLPAGPPSELGTAASAMAIPTTIARLTDTGAPQTATTVFADKACSVTNGNSMTALRKSL